MTSPEVYDSANTPADFGGRLLGSLPAFLHTLNADGTMIEPDIVSLVRESRQFPLRANRCCQEWHFALPLWPFRSLQCSSSAEEGLSTEQLEQTQSLLEHSQSGTVQDCELAPMSWREGCLHTLLYSEWTCKTLADGLNYC